jgi:hypothetical protein
MPLKDDAKALALVLVVDNDSVPLVQDIAAGVLDLDERIADIRDRRQIPFAFLWETVGKPMLAAGKKTQVLDGIRYHVEAPREREYCIGCPDHGPTLLHTCTTPIDERRGVIRKMDARPSFWFRPVKEKDA